MRNLFLLFVLLIFAGQLQASDFEHCKALLTHNFSENSSFHRIDLDSVELQSLNRARASYNNDPFPKKVLTVYLEKFLGCRPGVVSFNQGPFGVSTASCDYLGEDNPSSFVCYLESNLGYFITNINFMEEMTVIYNRWD